MIPKVFCVFQLVLHPSTGYVIPSSPPPPPPTGCGVAAPGSVTIEERVRFSEASPLEDCLLQTQTRTCTCSDGSLDCDPWSPDTYSFDACVSGCGTAMHGAEACDLTRTRYLERDPATGVCVEQQQARCRACVGLSGGSEGSFGTYDGWCVHNGSACTAELLYDAIECGAPGGPPPPAPPAESFFSDTVLLILISAGGLVVLGGLLIGFTYVITPERATSLGTVFGSLSTLVSRIRGTSTTAKPPPASLSNAGTRTART